MRTKSAASKINMVAPEIYTCSPEVSSGYITKVFCEVAGVIEGSLVGSQLVKWSRLWTRGHACIRVGACNWNLNYVGFDLEICYAE